MHIKLNSPWQLKSNPHQCVTVETKPISTVGHAGARQSQTLQLEIYLLALATNLIFALRPSSIKFTALSTLADSYHINLFCLTHLISSAELLDCTPLGFTLIHSPRPNITKTTLASGGGTAFLIRNPVLFFLL